MKFIVAASAGGGCWRADLTCVMRVVMVLLTSPKRISWSAAAAAAACRVLYLPWADIFFSCGVEVRTFDFKLLVATSFGERSSVSVYEAATRSRLAT